MHTIPHEGEQFKARHKIQHSVLHGPLGHSTRRFLRSFRINIELATWLAFVAGHVNSVAFLHFGTFVSHISGHATRTVVEFIEGNNLEALIFFLEIMVFIFGAFVSAFLLNAHSPAQTHKRYVLPILVEALCLFAFIVIDSFHGILWFRIGTMGLSTLLLAFAMGLQNAMLRHASGAVIRTTHMTGVATDLGVELGGAFAAALQTWKRSRSDHDLGWTLVWHEFATKLEKSRFYFHCLLLSFFFMGAALGSVGYIYLMNKILIVPLFILCLILGREFIRPFPKAPAT